MAFVILAKSVNLTKEHFLEILELFSENREPEELARFENDVQLDTVDDTYLTDHLANQLGLDADAVAYICRLGQSDVDQPALIKICDAGIRVANSTKTDNSIKGKGKGKSGQSASSSASAAITTKRKDPENYDSSLQKVISCT